MNAVPFDTLKIAPKLEAAGFSGPQAAGASEAMAEAMAGSELATKADILAVKVDLLAVKADLHAVKTDLELKLELLRRDMTIRLGAMLIGSTSVILAALRFMPMHP
jgi:hypothetical protein